MDQTMLKFARQMHERPVTENERYWIEIIRLASHDTDPAPTLALTQTLRRIFEKTIRISGVMSPTSASLPAERERRQ